MILAPISGFSRYLALNPHLDIVARALADLDPSTIVNGRRELLPDTVFLVGAPDAVTRPSARLEAHRRFLDVQVVLEGLDTIGWAPLATCTEIDTPYDDVADIEFYRDPPVLTVPIPAGYFTVFFPDDAHAPLLGDGLSVNKCVFKVRL